MLLVKVVVRSIYVNVNVNVVGAKLSLEIPKYLYKLHLKFETVIASATP